MQAVPVGKISEAKVCRKAEGNLKNFNLSKNIECKENGKSEGSLIYPTFPQKQGGSKFLYNMQPGL